MVSHSPQTSFEGSSHGQALRLRLVGGVDQKLEPSECDYALGHHNHVLLAPGQVVAAAVSVEDALDYPMLRPYGGAPYSRRTGYDDQHEAEQEVDQQSCGALVGSIAGHSARPAVQEFDSPKQPLRVHCSEALASRDLLRCIVSARAFHFGSPHALAVNGVGHGT